MTFLSLFRGVVLSLFICLMALALCTPSMASSSSSITANRAENRVLVFPDMLLDVDISLDAGPYSGRNADWWLYAETDFGVYHYDLSGAWLPGKVPSYQGPLFSFPTFKVLSVAGLPPSTYTFKFGYDLNMNGVMDGFTSWDDVEVVIHPADCPNTSTSLDALSQTQQAFIASRGNPDLFTLNFVSEELNSIGLVRYSSSVRRIESWYYNSQGVWSSALFDNGFFVKEISFGTPVTLQATHISPSQFTHCMSSEDIIALMGEPSCSDSEQIAGSTYTYMRYNPNAGAPAATVVLENGVLVTVVAGFSYTLSESATADLCSAN